MKNINNISSILLLSLICFGHALADQITVVLDPSVPPNLADFQLWIDTILPIQRQIALTPDITTLKISGLNTQGVMGAGCPDSIDIGKNNHVPTNPNDLSNPFYAAISHEFAHLRPCGIANNLFGEGLAEGTSKSVLWLLRQQNPEFAAWTNVLIADLIRNTNPGTILTWQETGNGAGFISYPLAGGMFEVLSGGEYRRFGELMESISTRNVTLGQLFAKYLDAADHAFADVDGQKPSDFLQSSPITAQAAPDGKYLSVYVFPFEYNASGHICGSAIVDDSGKDALCATSAVVNRMGLVSWGVSDKANGVFSRRTDGHLKWWVNDSTGKTVLSGDANNSVNASGLFYTDRIATPNPTEALTGAVLPDGGYQVNGCWVPPDATDCTSNANLMANTYFPVLRGVKDWWKNHHFVFANGGDDYQCWKFTGTRQISLAKQNGDVTEAVQLPGLLVIDLHNSRKDVVVTDGIRSKTYSAAYRSPIYTDTPSRFIPWTGNGDKFRAAANSADWANDYITPGAIFTLWGSNFTVNGPTSAPAYIFPLPLTLDSIQVVVRVNGIDYPAPLLFVSPTQINFLVPALLNGTKEAQVRAILNGKATNPIHVWVGVKPAAFYADFATKQPAALFATGPQTGQLITETNPARTGDWIQSYWNSLGPVQPPVKDGYAAGINPVSAVIAPVTVTVGGKAANSWAGAAPGFAGLYQVNYQIPPGLPAGLVDVVITVGGVANTTQIRLAVAP